MLDRSPAMLARAAAKGLETREADAQSLPVPDESADALTMVSMLHHVDDPPRALAEARRVLRPGGRLALMVYAREDIAAQWYHDYFPSTRAWMVASHPTLAELTAELPGARRLAGRLHRSRGRVAVGAVGVPRARAGAGVAEPDELLRAPGARSPRGAARRPGAPALRARGRPWADRGRGWERAGLGEAGRARSGRLGDRPAGLVGPLERGAVGAGERDVSAGRQRAGTRRARRR